MSEISKTKAGLMVKNEELAKPEIISPVEPTKEEPVGGIPSSKTEGPLVYPAEEPYGPRLQLTVSATTEKQGERSTTSTYDTSTYDTSSGGVSTSVAREQVRADIENQETKSARRYDAESNSPTTTPAHGAFPIDGPGLSTSHPERGPERDSDDSIVVTLTAQLVEEDSSELPVAVASKQKPFFIDMHNKYVRLGLCSFCLLILGVIAVVAVVSTRPNDASNPTATPTPTTSTNISNPWKQSDYIVGKIKKGELGNGVSLALQGALLAVSSPNDHSSPIDDSEPNDETAAGSVSVYNLVNGTVKSQVGQTIYGVPEDGAKGKLSEDGRRLGVFAKKHNLNGTKSQIGQVRVFELDVEAKDWKLLGDPIYGDDVKDRAGTDIAFSHDGDIIAVSLALHGGSEGPGAVRVYQYSNKSWVQMGSDLTGSIKDARFGWAIDISADGLVLVVGSRWDSNENGEAKAGSLSVFEYDTAVLDWKQRGQTIHGSREEDIFGATVSISADGMTVAGGAYYNADSGFYRSGHVRVFTFDKQNSEWEQLGKTIIGDGEGDNLAPVSLSGDGRRVVVGAPDAKNERGYARVFDFLGDDWTQVGGKIHGPEINADFGMWTDLSGDGRVLAVGSPTYQELGAVYLFNLPLRKPGTE